MVMIMVTDQQSCIWRSPVYPHQAAGAAPALALHLGETPPDGLGNIIARAGQSILKNCHNIQRRLNAKWVDLWIFSSKPPTTYHLDISIHKAKRLH